MHAGWVEKGQVVPRSGNHREVSAVISPAEGFVAAVQSRLVNLRAPLRASLGTERLCLRRTGHVQDREWAMVVTFEGERISQVLVIEDLSLLLDI